MGRRGKHLGGRPTDGATGGLPWDCASVCCAAIRNAAVIAARTSVRIIDDDGRVAASTEALASRQLRAATRLSVEVGPTARPAKLGVAATSPDYLGMWVRAEVRQGQMTLRPERLPQLRHAIQPVVRMIELMMPTRCRRTGADPLLFKGGTAKAKV